MEEEDFQPYDMGTAFLQNILGHIMDFNRCFEKYRAAEKNNDYEEAIKQLGKVAYYLISFEPMD